MIAYYKLAETNPGLLSQQLVYQPLENNIPQDILPTRNISIGQSYSIDELIKRMIVYSDNSAYEILYEHIDAAPLTQIYSDLNVDINKAIKDPAGNIVSVKNYASAFRILYNSSYLSKQMSEKALELLSQTDYKDGLVASLPSETIISHKFGERFFQSTNERQLHDCGIIYLPQRPYLLCIMTRGKDFAQLSLSIKTISQQIYTALKP